MRLISKTTIVPALTEPDERDREGNPTNAVRAEFGRAAIDLGTPDRGLNDDRTDAVDAIANVMHWLHGLEIDPDAVLHSAACHFNAEVETVEKRAVRVLGEAGIEAALHHTGGGIMVTEIVSDSIPDRVVWITESEDDEGGPYLLVAYPERYAEDGIEELSGTCSEADLVARTIDGLTLRGRTETRNRSNLEKRGEADGA